MILDFYTTRSVYRYFRDIQSAEGDNFLWLGNSVRFKHPLPITSKCLAGYYHLIFHSFFGMTFTENLGVSHLLIEHCLIDLVCIIFVSCFSILIDNIYL